MEKNKIMEEINEGAINTYEGVANGNIVTKLVVGVLSAAAIAGTVIFLKKRKNRKVEVEEEVELIPNENDKQNKK